MEGVIPKSYSLEKRFIYVRKKFREPLTGVPVKRVVKRRGGRGRRCVSAHELWPSTPAFTYSAPTNRRLSGGITPTTPAATK